MNHKKYIFITIFIFFLLFISWQIDLIHKNNKNISEIQLMSKLNHIASSYTNMSTSIEILTNKEKLMLGKDSVKNAILNMSDNERIIYFSGGEGLKQNLKPIQIYGIFESWLYIYTKDLPYDIIAIAWPHTSGGLANTNGQMVTVTNLECEELFNNTNLDGLSNKQAAKKIAEKWIEHTGYVKK